MAITCQERRYLLLLDEQSTIDRSVEDRQQFRI